MLGLGGGRIRRRRVKMRMKMELRKISPISCWCTGSSLSARKVWALERDIDYAAIGLPQPHQGQLGSDNHISPQEAGDSLSPVSVPFIIPSGKLMQSSTNLEKLSPQNP